MATNEKSSAVLTDTEIIKSLEIYREQLCKDCKVDKTICCSVCIATVINRTLDFINRFEADKEALIAGQETLQKVLAEKNAEIEKLTGNLKFVRGTVERQKADNERLKNLLAEEEAQYNECAKRFYTEGVKEFAERLKDNFPYKNACYTFEGIEYRIDNLVKEMVGDAE